MGMVIAAVRCLCPWGACRSCVRLLRLAGRHQVLLLHTARWMSLEEGRRPRLVRDVTADQDGPTGHGEVPAGWASQRREATTQNHPPRAEVVTQPLGGPKEGGTDRGPPLMAPE